MRALPSLGRGKIAALSAIAALGLAFLVPLRAAASDSDLTGSAIFRFEGSNGYTILGLAGSKRADGRGVLSLIVARRSANVTYRVPAIVTPTRLEADLGALGRISADVVPSGEKETLRSQCGREVQGFEPRLYRGTFEFHGELGYTDAVAAEVPEYAEFPINVLCAGVGSGEESGAGWPGARLHAVSRRGARRESLRLNKNGPRQAVVFSATLAERRDGVWIRRSVFGRRAAGAFDYDPQLRTATVAPPAPFSGTATFNRRADPANRWTGDLSVDFPGEPDVPLAGAGFSVRIAHARRS